MIAGPAGILGGVPAAGGESARVGSGADDFRPGTPLLILDRVVPRFAIAPHYGLPPRNLATNRIGRDQTIRAAGIQIPASICPGGTDKYSCP
jgi:hypothetical protein